MIDTYISGCETMIASGKSIDSKWDEFKNSIAGVSGTVWLIVFASIFGGIMLIIVVAFLVRRLRKEESEIDELENMVVNQKWQDEEKNSDIVPEQIFQERSSIREPTNAIPTGSTLSPVRVMLSIPPTIPPTVAHYVSQMRQAGYPNETIVSELEKSGWSARVVQAATG
ncbi:MAG: hypothetical protein COZ49_03900 [Candidatus Yonathbacteria bacterium CG_4_10_14_3_um_filter_47_65]|uniref:Uncharacterized protein n=2 Tax=Parcubacteria group TaxID=1794811 RepID=A0A2M8D7L4_9BACT|nr:MAG: hypothetical protein AUJ44_00270 [Candidatus Nomurabacteria bacterium CG1_02_47_685]PIP03876.1 MAG: hypothetical protein COX54_01995 [Candidatus Yonathbacteria bacterium CG23_combo_of_CG06-09_8_20_14_all_46_18]PIQ32811.1 MAG: hypothetical protein COW61_00810 [Candidatus Yonathbacteria bacterium CG17_big_fil_post_rev_8_21_14_2_50_46_19]PIX56081.1 MAG: hypothetical protein COZ49_03900 [Candidatus Yonathbacteria bacterium CG_4_10_14_3_um_filter_47_65]PIY57804.1 MAG: hypothetical protein CO